MRMQNDHRRYIMVKALEDGVTIIGPTGKRYKISPQREIRSGEVMIAQFTEHTSAIKVRGRAEIYTKIKQFLKRRG